MIRIGLSSTALLAPDYRDVLRVASAAGFDAIEWGGEMHAPGGDPRAAEAILIDTLSAGLTVASYAPLYRCQAAGEADSRFASLLEAAAFLQAPFIRIFAGGRRAARRLSPEKDPALPGLAAEARRLGDLAAEKGRTLCVCPGLNTWVDCYEAAEAFIAAVGHPFVRLAWEPLPGARAEAASASLERLGADVRLILARKLGRDGQPGRLASDEADWRRRLAAFKAAEGDPKMGSFVIVGAARGELGPEGVLPGLEEDLRLLRALAAEIEGAPRGGR